jgi:hypothetical protein
MTEEERIYATTLNLIGTPAAAELPAIQADLDEEHKTALWHHLAVILNALERAGESPYLNFDGISGESGHQVVWTDVAWVARR